MDWVLWPSRVLFWLGSGTSRANQTKLRDFVYIYIYIYNTILDLKQSWKSRWNCSILGRMVHLFGAQRKPSQNPICGCSPQQPSLRKSPPLTLSKGTSMFWGFHCPRRKTENPLLRNFKDRRTRSMLSRELDFSRRPDRSNMKPFEVWPKQRLRMDGFLGILTKMKFLDSMPEFGVLVGNLIEVEPITKDFY